MSDDREALGIPPDAPVYTGSNELPEGWRVDWVGVRLASVPPRPWPWPYVIWRQGPQLWMVIQIWRRTISRPGFAYSVLWHPENGRAYHAVSDDPDMGSLLRDAQRVMRRETRGRPRQRPSSAQFMADFDKIEHAMGKQPSRRRMADEYSVDRDTVRKWLQRPEWLEAVPDKYRTE